ncbi:uncharacterized protein E0L32_009135 [Thyridium curvatum]|uniref:PEBP-like protein n=1 Tax=Thyridium curvatum TaxID=1093900 RepID=A0A507AJP0_9PEZI|nr:uncharacterized protein E0L32_009135 [Thyridium curvatum]TPX09662.1 hypothetical protein E0L32_009135 [Thyridium curvatum]
MYSPSLVLLATVAGALARTPAGFEPSSNTQLIVEYNNIAAMNGMMISKEASSKAPRLATAEKLTGTFAVIMVDLDIPSNTSRTNTLLHWMQMGLTSADRATMLNTTSGQNMAFVLENRQNTPAAAEYIGPNPPARNPLSHRYTEILVNVDNLQAASMNALATAARTRLGFNAMEVLMRAGLQNKVVAGNFFNVTNPGPATGNGGNGGGANRTSTDGGRTNTGTTTSARPGASNTSLINAGAVSGAQPALLLALATLAAVFLGF